LLAACVIAMPAAANAQSVRQVLADFGMLGTWATDCNQPSGDNNWYAIYAGMPNGSVMRTYYNTPDRKKPFSQFTITQAVRLPSSLLSYSQQGVNNHERDDVVLMKQGNRYHVWSSVRSDGKVLVKEGKFTSNGDESPWQTKCGS